MGCARTVLKRGQNTAWPSTVLSSTSGTFSVSPQFLPKGSWLGLIWSQRTVCTSRMRTSSSMLERTDCFTKAGWGLDSDLVIATVKSIVSLRCYLKIWKGTQMNPWKETGESSLFPGKNLGSVWITICETERREGLAQANVLTRKNQSGNSIEKKAVGRGLWGRMA